MNSNAHSDCIQWMSRPTWLQRTFYSSKKSRSGECSGTLIYCQRDISINQVQKNGHHPRMNRSFGMKLRGSINRGSLARPPIPTGFIFDFKMPRGVVLTEKERGEILGMWQSGKSKSFIAKVLGRSKGVVTSFWKDTEGYGTITRRPKPKKCRKGKWCRFWGKHH